MADDDKSKEEENESTDTEDDKKPETQDEAEKWKALARKHEKDAKAAAKKLQDLADADKSETQKAADKAADAEKRADEAERRALRLEVAYDKGLTLAQAKRISGETREELEADADDFLSSIKPSDNGKPTDKPREDLRGGNDPTEDPEEMDPRKLADMVPRL